MRTALILVAALAVPAFALAGEPAPAPAPAPAPSSNLPADKDPMTTTKPAEHNAKRHARLLDRARQGDVELLFLGDSITELWKDNEVWKQYYAPLKAANFGTSGDAIENVLWRVGEGEIDPKLIRPKVIVLLIGTNNVGGDSTRDIVEGTRNLVKAIREKAPESKLLLLGIFPCQQKRNKWRRQIEDINAQTAKLDDGKMVRFLDLAAKFVEPDESISKEVMPDHMHPALKGYRLWAEGMEPLLAEMMGFPARKPESFAKDEAPKGAAGDGSKAGADAKDGR
jgi:lysophospholipase L1-like esterase